MSKVLDTKEKNLLVKAGFKIDKVVHRRRRERDLRLKKVNYVRSK